MSFDRDYPAKVQECGQITGIGPIDYIPPTLQEQIEARIVDVKENIKRQEELLGLLRRNPDIQRILELMR